MQKWQLVLLVGATAFGCGGDSKGDSDPDFGTGGSSTGGANSAGASAGTGDAGAAGAADSGSANVTGGEAQTAGVAGAADSAGTSAAGGEASTGGGTPSGGQGAGTSGAGGEDECDVGPLWETVTLNNGILGLCFPKQCESSFGLLVGAIRFDAEGRVTDVTGFDPEDWATDEWQQFIADNRWPCYANQTLAYCCSVGA